MIYHEPYRSGYNSDTARIRPEARRGEIPQRLGNAILTGPSLCKVENGFISQRSENGIDSGPSHRKLGSRFMAKISKDDVDSELTRMGGGTEAILQV